MFPYFIAAKMTEFATAVQCELLTALLLWVADCCTLLPLKYTEP